jgi:hypothetical protein
LKFLIPVESIVQKKGGVIIYDPIENKILRQYIHDKEWGGRRIGWRGGKIYGDYLIATDWTDLHIFNWKEWKYVKTIKQTYFNDLHYVDVYDDKLYVVNTGLDSIEIFRNPLDPELHRTVYLFKRFKKMFKHREIDRSFSYNEQFKIKPHVAHPNCICHTGKHLFVTCFQKKPSSETGEIVCLKTGQKLTRRSYSCHDGDFYNGNFYLSNTRKAQLLIFKNVNDRKLPIENPDYTISFGKKGWWRGMVLHEGLVYVFASFYSNKKRTALMAVVNLKKKKTVKRVTMDVKDDIYWDTIYQPNLLED